MAAGLALLEDAYISGYASIDDQLTVPLPRAAMIDLAACFDAFDPDAIGHQQLLAVMETGRLTATRTALHRARLRLYAKHRKAVVAAARKALTGLPRTHLTASLILLSGQHRTTRRDQALSTLRSAAYGLTGEPADWHQANDAAATAAAVRGHAEAAASPTSGGPPDPKKVAAGITAAAPIIVGTGTWVQRQLARQAWQLSGLQLASADDPQALVDDNLDELDGIGAQLEDDMHATMSGAFSDYFESGPGTTLGLIAWVSEEDDRVCPDCDDNESNGPYPIGGLPDMPAHPLCRCWFELA